MIEIPTDVLNKAAREAVDKQSVDGVMRENVFYCRPAAAAIAREAFRMGVEYGEKEDRKPPEAVDEPPAKTMKELREAVGWSVERVNKVLEWDDHRTIIVHENEGGTMCRHLIRILSAVYDVTEDEIEKSLCTTRKAWRTSN